MWSRIGCIWCSGIVIAQTLRSGHGVLRGKVWTLLRMVAPGQRATTVDRWCATVLRDRHTGCLLFQRHISGGRRYQAEPLL
uniref:Putative secreted peptide n=1 Tax=Anopheles braziliensis TaxID=58242 RepID=A0A2M3ZP17_9DIPT